MSRTAPSGPLSVLRAAPMQTSGEEWAQMLEELRNVEKFAINGNGKIGAPPPPLRPAAPAAEGAAATE